MNYGLASMKTDEIICILAKNPKPGKVKTELESVLGNKQSALLSRAFLLDTISTALKVPGADIVIAYWPGESLPDFEDIIFLYQSEETNKKASQRAKEIILVPQLGRDLGERIVNLSNAFFGEGAKRTLFICSDNPLLDVSIIKASFELLKSNHVVMGPTFDGGYYILGTDGHYPSLFAGINWTAGDIYRQLSDKICSSGMTWQELEISYDVDRPEELDQLYFDIDTLRLTGIDDICCHTEKCLANLKK
jgi:uncharacterized protein